MCSSFLGDRDVELLDVPAVLSGEFLRLPSENGFVNSWRINKREDDDVAFGSLKCLSSPYLKLSPDRLFRTDRVKNFLAQIANLRS